METSPPTPQKTPQKVTYPRWLWALGAGLAVVIVACVVLLAAQSSTNSTNLAGGAVERLIPAGRMAPAGLAAVERAKADGSWSAYDAAERLEEPPELAAALDAVPAARASWDAFAPSARKGILWWVMSAKRADTRERRIAEVVAKAADGTRAQFDT